MKKRSALLAAFLSLLAIAPVFTETFRVRSLTAVTISSQQPEPVDVAIGYNDALSIAFTPNDPFLRGVEIEVKIPQEILVYPGSIAWALYNAITPEPSAGRIDYTASQLSIQPLPQRLSFVLQVPTRRNHGLRTGPYATVLQSIHDPARGPLLFRLMPIMKGLPSGIESMQFTIRVKPVLSEEGALRLTINQPEERDPSLIVRINEIPQQNHESLIFLNPGNHHLSVVSELYRNEVRVFTVEAARITALNIEMQGTAPVIHLVAPENALITINGDPVQSNRSGLTVEPGDYLIQFTVGDYQLTRQITVERGRTYTVSMIVDINVTESP